MSACPENWKDVLFFCTRLKTHQRVILFTAFSVASYLWFESMTKSLWIRLPTLDSYLEKFSLWWWRKCTESLLCYVLVPKQPICCVLSALLLCILQSPGFFLTWGEKTKKRKEKRKKVTVPNLKDWINFTQVSRMLVSWEHASLLNAKRSPCQREVPNVFCHLIAYPHFQPPSTKSTWVIKRELGSRRCQNI